MLPLPNYVVPIQEVEGDGLGTTLGEEDATPEVVPDEDVSTATSPLLYNPPPTCIYSPHSKVTYLALSITLVTPL